MEMECVSPFGEGIDSRVMTILFNDRSTPKPRLVKECFVVVGEHGEKKTERELVINTEC